MSTSPKRYGLDVKDDLELELRLRRIEAALEGKLESNQEEEQSGSRSTVPQVTGLRVTGQTPGSVTIAWNPVAIPNLRRYEVDFSQSLGFATKQTFNENTTNHTFVTASETSGGGGATWFARVRAVNVFGQTGQYSATLNLTTGQAQTEDIGDDAVTDDKVAPQTTIEIITTGLRGIIDGFVLSRTSATILAIGAGFATTSVEGTYARLTSSTTIDIATSGAGGLGVARATNTWYHVFVISSSNSTSRYADTSITAANIPSGFTAYRRVGSFLTDGTGSGEITNFTQDGDEFLWSTPPTLNYNAAPGATTAASVTLTVPIDVKVRAILNVALAGGGAAVAAYLSALDTDDVQADITATPLATIYNNGGDHAIDAMGVVHVRTNTSGQIRRRQTVGGSTLRIGTLGWLDQRGRNA